MRRSGRLFHIIAGSFLLAFLQISGVSGGTILSSVKCFIIFEVEPLTLDIRVILFSCSQRAHKLHSFNWACHGNFGLLKILVPDQNFLKILVRSDQFYLKKKGPCPEKKVRRFISNVHVVDIQFASDGGD